MENRPDFVSPILILSCHPKAIFVAAGFTVNPKIPLNPSTVRLGNCIRLFHPPQPQPLLSPEAGGEGVGDAAGFSNHKALNRSNFFPSPPMGERVRVRGK
jgi:hypothetical protein